MYHLMRAICAILLCTLIVALGCSDSNKGVNNTQPPVVGTDTIGPAGGTVALSGQIELVIPAGALASDVVFTIQENKTPAAMADSVLAVSPVFTIGPAGTNFSPPCTVTINYNEALLAGHDESELQVSTYSSGTWSELSALVDEVNNKASAEVAHLSDYSVTVYERTAPGPGMSAMLDASAPAIEYYGKLWSQLHRMLWYIDKRGPLESGITYNKTTGRFSFEIYIGDDPDPDYDVYGFVLGGPLTYSNFCTDSIEGICLDTIQIPDTTVGPPAAIADGLHQNEVAIITWFADSNVGPGFTLAAAGTFSLFMLSHDAYRLTIPQENRLYPADTSRFEITSLNNNWNLNQPLQPGTNWSLDGTTWYWPTGSTEFVTRIDNDPDSLYALLTYAYDDTLGNIHAYYGADTADASIDLTTWLIGD